MKRTNFILNGFLALAIVLVFAQCSDNNNAATSSAAPAAGVAGSSNMKIAYVEIDSLLTKYNFWNDLNEVMIQKEENIRTTLNEKAKKLDADAKEFQRKLENNGFATRERAEQEQMRLMKQQQELQALQQKLSDRTASCIFPGYQFSVQCRKISRRCYQNRNHTLHVQYRSCRCDRSICKHDLPG